MCADQERFVSRWIPSNLAFLVDAKRLLIPLILSAISSAHVFAKIGYINGVDLAVQGHGCVAEMTASCRGEVHCFADSRLSTISSQSRSRLWVRSMSRSLLFSMIWVGEFRSWAGRTESLSFCFNTFQLIFSVSTRFFIIRPPALVSARDFILDLVRYVLEAITIRKKN